VVYLTKLKKGGAMNTLEDSTTSLERALLDGSISSEDYRQSQRIYAGALLVLSTGIYGFFKKFFTKKW